MSSDLILKNAAYILPLSLSIDFYDPSIAMILRFLGQDTRGNLTLQ